ncbi:S8 family serine peptidase [Streptomyces sp. NPDC051940]|uniref:S8 family serine peptidase n=1 Tax=Streptomyces sp. NPDC051940 TaxID=3155675 RepID=UPI00343085B8
MQLRSLAAAITVVAALVPAAVTARAASPDEGGGTSAAAPSSVTVPLPTGDSVTVERAGRAIRSTTVHPAPGRADMAFTTTSVGSGDLSVVPADAEPLLAAGRLDPRLFDVRALLDAGYGGDAAVHVIVQHGKGAGAAGKVRTAAGADARPGRSLTRLGMTPLDPEDPAAAAATWKRLTGSGSLAGGATKLWLDGRMKVSLDRSVPQINAPKAWADGYTGKGVTVAVLDTGYDSDHPDLAGRVSTSVDFTGTGSAEDDNGHGTHVASTIAGVDAVYRGVAPDADLAVGKVCDAGGNCVTSDVLAGVEWAAGTAHAKVVSMSLGGPAEGDDPVVDAINALSAQDGTLFVVAAGNSGENGTSTVEAPAIADAAMAVGAVDRDDQRAYFSSQGPRPTDNAVKPDITAPGVSIVAARMGGGHTSKSGTSMATPHVAGAAALVAQAHPDWTGEQIKGALMESAEPTAGLSPYQQGAGRVDVGDAVERTVHVSPVNLTTRAGWADTAGEESEQTVTFTNSADADVTLDLAIERPMSPARQSGNPGQFSVDRDHVTVPAHGTAQAVVTARGSLLPHGQWAAVLTASRAGEALTRTILAVDTPIPVHRVTVTATGRDGKGASGTALLVNRWTGDRYPVRLTSGTGTADVPEGQYWTGMTIISGSGSDRATAMTAASVTVDADASVALDARTAAPVRADVGDKKAAAVMTQAALALPVGTGWYTLSVVGTGTVGAGSVYATPVADADATYRTFAVLAAAGASSAAPSPFFYHVARSWSGGVPADPSLTVRRAELTDVHVAFYGQGADAAGTTAAAPYDPVLLPVNIDQSVRYPSQVHDYRTPGVWTDRANVAGGQSLATAPRTYGPDAQDSLDWAAAVVGPALPYAPLTRTGDTLTMMAAPWFVDGDGTRTGTDAGATGTVTLARDGAALGSWSTALIGKNVAVPAGPARYTLTADVVRNRATAAHSTRVTSVWGFDSATDDGEGTVLPLTAVRFTPYELDSYGRAAAGATTRVDVAVQRAPGAADAAVDSLRLQVSWDDGATWQQVRILPAAGTSPAHADVTAPAGASFATLRATVEASDGSTLTQTVTRAFGVNAAP